jgi:hypothetical protein
MICHCEGVKICYKKRRGATVGIKIKIKVKVKVKVKVKLKVKVKVKVKVKFTLGQATKAQRWSRGTTLYFL